MNPSILIADSKCPIFYGFMEFLWTTLWKASNLNFQGLMWGQKDFSLCCEWMIMAQAI